MGEVYRGTDTRLGRSVAIKVSPHANSATASSAKRAPSPSLNHPNICTLYDVGPNYLVMELVEGETLSKIIEAAARCRSIRRCTMRSRSSTRYRPRTLKASSIAI